MSEQARQQVTIAVDLKKYRIRIHRNTLAYRLKRIEEITGRSLGRADARLDFRLAFKIRKYLALMSEQQGLCAN